MKRNTQILSLMLIVSILFITSCAKNDKIERNDVRPVKAYQVKTLSSVDMSFAGIVSTENSANLAFLTSGQLVKLNVTAGDIVKKGQVLAQLDPQDYLLKIEVAKTEMNTTKAIFDRTKNLFERKAVSKQEFEVAQTNYVKAKVSYENAQNRLKDTKLFAPFSGTIETKHVENYQTVNAGTPIVRLIDPNRLEVEFTIAERNLRLIMMKGTTYKVRFDNYPEIEFDATLKEYVQSSLEGSGIPVTLKINDKRFDTKKYSISSGFSCNVTMNIINPGYEDVVYVPVPAILNKPSDKQNYVWIINNGKVEQRKVRLGELFDEGNIIIEEGLKKGDIVVIAGVSQLTNNQSVNILK